ncbi:glycosyltransferase family 4 protein [Moellerella wisconsensis]|uniref:glycosyltransferase family 4 protein n=1 Tax=Moellerella wisconsensis TaxID=158849 RepID=UPI000641570D|nr:glycosyltransferase family 4 protein [Moellerella wisconsensis]KLN95488.1 hypothetical protein VK86_15080 [Moellerella wisconsensis]
MRVLHIVGGDLSGGAARGAYWLHQALLHSGVDSWLLCDSLHAVDTNENTLTTCTTFIKKLTKVTRGKLDKFPISLIYKNRNKKVLFSSGLFGTDITKHQIYKSADIIHLHWVNNGYFNVANLYKIKKPIIWTIRDMWPITGGCHYSLDCDKYQTNCSDCPILKSGKTFDLSSFLQKRKAKFIQQSNIIAVGIGSWISDCTQKSYIFKGKTVKTIPNTIDTTLFKPVEKKIAKDFFDIKEKKIIAVGAQNTEDIYKGMDLLRQALILLENKEDYHILVFGRSIPQYWDDIGISYSLLGFMRDIYSLRMIYSASDVFISPSKYETFGKTIAEAMACGTPVVAFNVTGPIDIIDHMKNGYLAKAYDPTDLYNGIKWIFDKYIENKLGEHARIKIINNFSPNITANLYLDLYKSIYIS